MAISKETAAKMAKFLFIDEELSPTNKKTLQGLAILAFEGKNYFDFEDLMSILYEMNQYAYESCAKALVAVLSETAIEKIIKSLIRKEIEKILSSKNIEAACKIQSRDSSLLISLLNEQRNIHRKDSQAFLKKYIHPFVEQLLSIAKKHHTIILDDKKELPFELCRKLAKITNDYFNTLIVKNTRLVERNTFELPQFVINNIVAHHENTKKIASFESIMKPIERENTILTQIGGGYFFLRYINPEITDYMETKKKSVKNNNVKMAFQDLCTYVLTRFFQKIANDLGAKDNHEALFSGAKNSYKVWTHCFRQLVEGKSPAELENLPAIVAGNLNGFNSNETEANLGKPREGMDPSELDFKPVSAENLQGSNKQIENVSDESKVTQDTNEFVEISIDSLTTEIEQAEDLREMHKDEPPVEASIETDQKIAGVENNDADKSELVAIAKEKILPWPILMKKFFIALCSHAKPIHIDSSLPLIGSDKERKQFREIDLNSAYDLLLKNSDTKSDIESKMIDLNLASNTNNIEEISAILNEATYLVYTVSTNNETVFETTYSNYIYNLNNNGSSNFLQLNIQLEIIKRIFQIGCRYHLEIFSNKILPYLIKDLEGSNGEDLDFEKKLQYVSLYIKSIFSTREAKIPSLMKLLESANEVAIDLKSTNSIKELSLIKEAKINVLYHFLYYFVHSPVSAFDITELEGQVSAETFRRLLSASCLKKARLNLSRAITAEDRVPSVDTFLREAYYSSLPFTFFFFQEEIINKKMDSTLSFDFDNAECLFEQIKLTTLKQEVRFEALNKLFAMLFPTQKPLKLFSAPVESVDEDDIGKGKEKLYEKEKDKEKKKKDEEPETWQVERSNVIHVDVGMPPLVESPEATTPQNNCSPRSNTNLSIRSLINLFNSSGISLKDQQKIPASNTKSNFFASPRPVAQPLQVFATNAAVKDLNEEPNDQQYN